MVPIDLPFAPGCCWSTCVERRTRGSANSIEPRNQQPIAPTKGTTDVSAMPATRPTPSRLRSTSPKETYDSSLLRLQLGSAACVQRVFTFRPFDISKGDDRGGLFRARDGIELFTGRGARRRGASLDARGGHAGPEARVFRQDRPSRSPRSNPAKASRCAGRPECLERLRTANIVSHEREWFDQSLRECAA